MDDVKKTTPLAFFVYASGHKFVLNKSRSRRHDTIILAALKALKLRYPKEFEEELSAEWRVHFFDCSYDQFGRKSKKTDYAFLLKYVA